MSNLADGPAAAAGASCEPAAEAASSAAVAETAPGGASHRRDEAAFGDDRLSVPLAYLGNAAAEVVEPAGRSFDLDAPGVRRGDFHLPPPRIQLRKPPSGGALPAGPPVAPQPFEGRSRPEPPDVLPAFLPLPPGWRPALPPFPCRSEAEPLPPETCLLTRSPGVSEEGRTEGAGSAMRKAPRPGQRQPSGRQSTSGSRRAG